MSTLKDTELSTRDDRGISRTTNLQINRPYSKSSTAPSVRIHTSGLKAWSNFEVKVGIIMESTIVSCLWLDRSLYQSIILTHPSLSAMEGKSSRAASKESTARAEPKRDWGKRKARSKSNVVAKDVTDPTLDVTQVKLWASANANALDVGTAVTHQYLEMVSDFDRYDLNTSILLTQRKDGISIPSYNGHTGRP